MAGAIVSGNIAEILNERVLPPTSRGVRSELKALVIEAVREASLYSQIDSLMLPQPCDAVAEQTLLSALLLKVIEKPFCGLKSEHFLFEAHQELFARAHLPLDQIRIGLVGEEHVVTQFYEVLQEDCGPYAPGQLEELAYRVKELAEQRRLINMFRKLEIELRFGKIQVCDAEHALQEHLLRDVYGP